MSKANVADWPAVRDVVRRLDLSTRWVIHLIEQGELQAVRTRLGWLVDPSSVDAYETRRAQRREMVRC